MLEVKGARLESALSRWFEQQVTRSVAQAVECHGTGLLSDAGGIAGIYAESQC